MTEDSLSRRRLLGSAGALSGALILARVAGAAEDAAPQVGVAQAKADSLVLKLNDNPELGKVGGWKIVDLGAERVIVANTDKGLIARSAICPHRGCEVVYQADNHQFYCPCHRSQFDEDGHVVHGPARTGLKPYASDAAVVVSQTNTGKQVEVAPPRPAPPNAPAF